LVRRSQSAKEPQPTSFRNEFRQSAQATALLIVLFSGCSDFAVQAGADCGFPKAQSLAEAFLWRRHSKWFRLRARVTLSFQATTNSYATIISNGWWQTCSRATPPHQQNQSQRCI